MYLDFPKDTIDETADEEQVTYPSHPRTTARPEGDSNLVKEAIEILSKAERPVILAGHRHLLVPVGNGVPGIRRAHQDTLLHHAPDPWNRA